MGEGPTHRRQELLFPCWTDGKTCFRPAWSPSGWCSSVAGVAQPTSALEPPPASSWPTLKLSFLFSSDKTLDGLIPSRAHREGVCTLGANNPHPSTGACGASPCDQHPGAETPFAALSAGCIKQSQGAQKASEGSLCKLSMLLLIFS